MKKFLTVVIQCILFFVGWAVVAGVIPVPETGNPAVWRFWAELIPFAAILVFTFVFWVKDSPRLSLMLIRRPAVGIPLGLAAGVLWVAVSVALLMPVGSLHFTEHNAVPLLGLWLVSVLLNAAMQELLVRGYLFRLVESRYNTVAAALVTTALFTLMHGGAFEAGLIPILCVVSMSLAMTAALLATETLLTPIYMHFVWNFVGAVLLGGVSLAEDYPHMLRMQLSGNALFSGGDCSMEGSVVVLFVNILLALGFWLLGQCKREQAK